MLGISAIPANAAWFPQPGGLVFCCSGLGSCSRCSGVAIQRRHNPVPAHWRWIYTSTTISPPPRR